jgi:hypothetical protein|tara:strand:+ start:6220 stop:6807 length:588 start_codon:yes stop_codon:yes gene_type:complete
MNNDLMQKLAISKKIMDAHNNIPVGQSAQGLPMTENIPNAKYNIPDSILNENAAASPQMSEQQSQPITTDRIVSSKLPEEIKKLMMEHPIEQPRHNGGNVLSNEIIEGASRLMGNNKKVVTETKTNNVNPPSNNNSELRQMIRDVVRDTVKDVIREELQNAGLLTESDKITNETLSLRVGNHIFEGKVLKIKKIK